MYRFSVLSPLHLTIVLIGLFFLPSCLFLEDINPRLSGANNGPFITSWENLEQVKELIESGDYNDLSFAKVLLIRRANEWLEKEPFTVINSRFLKEQLSPASKPNDYVSLATYAHPDPKSENGLPYIQLSGNRNPQVDMFDRVPLANLSKAVDDLSLAYYFTNEETYAEKAAELIKTWFINEETRMNPNLNYAQIWPGISTGGAQGIVESRDFIPVLEGVSLIYESAFWTEEDHFALKLWFQQFLDWIAKNYGSSSYESLNVGTWLDAQKAMYALFTEQRHLLSSPTFIVPLDEKLDRQILSDGEQQFEVTRPNSQHYTYFNLKGFIVQSEMRNHADIGSNTHWKSLPVENAKLRTALDWLMPDEIAVWRYSQDFNTCRYIELFQPAALVFQDADYQSVVDYLIDEFDCFDIQTLLTHPPYQSNPGL